jgi:uncharacterized SAM-binding protein YcdF (DUF218 family)
MRRLGRGLGRTIRGVVALWLLTYAAVLGWTYLWPLDRPVPQGDVIVCLSGGGDVPNATPGDVPSRAETCDALFDAGAAPRVLFSGGALNARLPSSAVTMAEATDIPADAQLIEPRAESTLQNAAFTLDLVDPAARLILVTEAYHLPRAWMSFRLMGAQDVTLRASARVVANAEGRLFQRHPLLRESLAIWFNLARYAGFRVGALLGMPEEARLGWLQ